MRTNHYLFRSQPTDTFYIQSLSYQHRFPTMGMNIDPSAAANLVLATVSMAGYPEETFSFRTNQERTQWIDDLNEIRAGAAAMNRHNYTRTVPAWLQSVKVKANHWGSNCIPLDIKDATNETEDTWALDGNRIDPIFRDGIPKLANARVEYNHCQRGSTFMHMYVAVNGDKQSGTGIPPYKNMVAFDRNKLQYVEIGYKQLDGTTFTIRTKTMKAGRDWKAWIENVWQGISHASNIVDQVTMNNAYRTWLDQLRREIEERGHAYFPPCIRTVVHELEAHFGERRTVFAPAITT